MHISRRSIAVLPVAALLCSSCSDRAPAGVQATSENHPTVAVVMAQRQNLSRTAEFAAEFRPWEEVDLHAKVAGYLKSLYVDVGDRVRQGQLIGVLEVPEYAEELAQASATEKRSQLDVIRAKSEVTRAQSALDIRKVSWERLQSVSKARPGLVAQQEIDNAAARYQEAEAQLATAKAALAATEQQVNVTAASRARVTAMMSYLRITAPFSGVITKRYANPGAMIQAGTASQTQAMPVVRISHVDTLRLVLPLPESIVPAIQVGRPVEVRVDALKRVFEGKVARFTGRLDASTRTMETEVDLKNPGGVIIPGMFGYASIVLDTRKDTLAVPVQAVSGGEANPTVLVVNEMGRLEERHVSVGLETPGMIEITSGLHDRERVVIGSRTGLSSGKQVQTKLLKQAEVAGRQ